VAWRVTDLGGALLDQGTLATEIAPQKSETVHTLDLNSLAQLHGENNLLVWLNLRIQDREVSRNLVSFGRPKELNLENPALKHDITEIPTGFRVTVTAEKPALWVWLNLGDKDVRYSDNFVHLDSRASLQIDVTPAVPLTRADFVQALVVRSLFDTYEPTA